MPLAAPTNVQHNVRLQLTYLDVDKGETPMDMVKTEALLRKALEPLPKRNGSGGGFAAAV